MFSTFLFVIHICMEGSEFVLLAAQVQLLAVPQHKNETSVSRFKNGILFFQIFQNLWYQVWVQFKQNFTKIRGSCFFIGHRQQFTLKAFSRSFVLGKLPLTRKYWCTLFILTPSLFKSKSLNIFVKETVAGRKNLFNVINHIISRTSFI